MSTLAIPPPLEAGARRLRLAAAAAAVVALGLRLPFVARRMWDHDSIQFALGVERYDLAAHHPHPPGYPLYIAFLKLCAALGVDSLNGMVGLSLAFAALGAAFSVLLAARLATEGAPHGGGSDAGIRAGLFAGALFATDPLLWFYGELPLLYAVEGGMTVLLSYAALAMRDGDRAFVTACALFAIAGGLRPSTIVLLAPLFLFGCYRALRRGSLTKTALLTGPLVGAAIVLAWLVPLLAAAGGYAAYRRIGDEHFRALLPHTSILYGAGWGALGHNLTVLTKWALQGLLPAVLAMGVVWLLAGGRGAREGVRLLAARLPWLLAWGAPPILFFALFHITKAGYTLVHLPALLVAAALLVAPSLSRPASLLPTIAGIVAATTVGAALFLFGADRRLDQPRALAVVRNEWNRGTIATYERDLDRLRAELARFPAASTVLATIELSGTGASGAEGFLYPWQRHLQWYLPAYTVLHLVPEEGKAFGTRGHQPFVVEPSPIVLPAGTERLVLVLSAPTGDRLPLPLGAARQIGSTFYVLAVPVSRDLRIGPLLLTVSESRKRAA